MSTDFRVYSSHFIEPLPSVVYSVNYLILYEVKVSIVSHAKRVSQNVCAEVGRGSNQEIFFPLFPWPGSLVENFSLVSLLAESTSLYRGILAS